MRISDWSSDVCSSDLQLVHSVSAAIATPAIASPSASVIQRRRVAAASALPTARSAALAILTGGGGSALVAGSVGGTSLIVRRLPTAARVPTVPTFARAEHVWTSPVVGTTVAGSR